MIFPPFVFIMIPFIPESPRWLASVGRTEEVADVLALLHGNGATRNTPEIQEQASLINKTAAHEAQIDSSWKEVGPRTPPIIYICLTLLLIRVMKIFAGGELQNLRRLILAATTGFLHQATGINVVIYYAPVIFSGVGLDKRISYIMSCVGSVCLLIGSVLPILWIERGGRRMTMMLGAWTCGICMGMIAATGAVSKYYPGRATASGWAGAAFVLLFQFSFGIG